MALWGTLWREILFDFYQKSNKIHGRSLSVNFCSEVNSENTDSKAALLANTPASSSKQAAQAKAKGLRSLLCAIILPFRRASLHSRPNRLSNRLKTRFSATVRSSNPKNSPERCAYREATPIKTFARLQSRSVGERPLFKSLMMTE